MMASGAIRRSARARVPSKKYSIDVFEGLDILSSDSEAVRQIPELRDAEQDEDFAVEEAAVPGEESIISDADVSDESAVATPNEEFEDNYPHAGEADVTMIAETPVPLKGLLLDTKHIRQRVNRKLDKELHARGVPLSHEYFSKEDNLKYMVGRDTEDLIEFTRSRDQWIHDATLPTRRTFEDGSGGLRYPFGQTTEEREYQATTAWDWYYDRKNGEEFHARQNTTIVDPNEVEQYWLPQHRRKKRFLMGPYGKQTLLELECAQALHLGKAWGINGTTGEARPTSKISDYSRNGWVLNAGYKVQSMDWAPTCHAGFQYLAIVTSQGPHQLPTNRSAFGASESHPASIQLWAFPTDFASGVQIDNDLSQLPRMLHLICSRWGAVRHIRWCPFARKPRRVGDVNEHSIGLLAGVWSDGHVRVVEVRIDQTSDSTSYVLYKSAAFEAKPPDTICTCLAWLSNRNIAVGCANGHVAIYDISQTFAHHTAVAQDSQPSTDNGTTARPKPHFWQLLHQSYILNIIACLPSLPHFIVTSSMDGLARLTDIRSPLSDFVLSTRSRSASSALAYHFALKAALAPEDNDFVKILSLRRFFTAANFARTEGHVSCISAGKVHAAVLIGSTDGSVLATNPMRRGINTKCTQYQQIWFRHEWVEKKRDRSTEESAAENSTANAIMNDTREGLSRFTEGYKVESLLMTKAPRTARKVKDALPFSTIFEEETGITQVVWNPNIEYGSWAAAGMGSGLVRVEDLAI